MSSSTTLSLVIPCYNEENTLAACIMRVLSIRTTELKLELIIVDDCSTDKSLTIAQELAKVHPEITVLQHKRNRGKGAALRTGLARATGESNLQNEANLESSFR